MRAMDITKAHIVGVFPYPYSMYGDPEPRGVACASCSVLLDVDMRVLKAIVNAHLADRANWDSLHFELA